MKTELKAYCRTLDGASKLVFIPEPLPEIFCHLSRPVLWQDYGMDVMAEKPPTDLHCKVRRYVLKHRISSDLWLYEEAL